MPTPSIIKESYGYKIPAQIFRFLAQVGPHSLIQKFFTRIPGYASQTATQQSHIFKLLGRFIAWILTPFMVLGSAIARGIPTSRINQPKPLWLQSSLSWQTIYHLKVEYVLWLFVLYPLVDYVLRNLPQLQSLSGSWDELLLLFVLLAWPLQMAIRGRITWQHTMLDIPIVIYAGILIFIFFLYSPDMGWAVEGIRVYLQYLLCYFIATNLLTQRHQLDVLLNGFIVVATFLAIIGIGQYILGVEMPASWVDQAEAGVRTRAFSLVTSPNILGSLLVLFIPLTLSKIIQHKGSPKKQLLFGISCLLMLICLAFTYSRGAWLALMGAMILYSFLYNPKLLLLLAVGGLAVLKFVPGIGSRLAYMFSTAYIISSLRAGRLARWGTALDHLKENPWLGEGFGRFGGAVAARRVPGSFYVDNFYLKTAVECGIIGLLALLWLLLNVLRLGFSVLRATTDKATKLMAIGLLTGLTGVMFHCCVENIFEVPLMSSYFWFIVGMLAVIPRFTKEH